jgi:hypothetical protein
LRKATVKLTEKTTEKQQTVENQALDESSFRFFGFTEKTHPPSPPTRPADHLTFVKSDPRFFYTFLQNRKN